MLSSAYETKIRINKRVLLGCIDRATLLVKENDKKPIIMDIKEEYMELKISSYIGSMNEDIGIEKEGKNMMIVNPKAPCFIRNDNDDYIYLILPVNFNTADN